MATAPLGSRAGIVEGPVRRAGFDLDLRGFYSPIPDTGHVPSEAAGIDAIELFGLKPERVVAVHHGCSPWATEAALRFRRYGVPFVSSPLESGRPYAVNVSSLYGLKNAAA